jgi:eukaryotic-like serine/threonine-protein kinase
MNASCLASEQLDALVTGKLPANEEAPMVRHLDQCPTCQQRLEQLVAAGSWVSNSAWRLQEASPRPERALSDLMLRLETCRSDVRAQASADDGETAEFAYLSQSKHADSLGCLGSYEILQVIGRGGMGVVFKARDPNLNRVVAIKVMGTALTANAQARERFQREARSIAAINHDHVVTVHAVGQHQGIPFLVMEYVQGVTLAERIEKSAPLPLQEIVLVGIQVADALARAHAQGIVHRDVKPGNILLQSQPARAKIGDFGLAHLIDEGPLTRSGMVAGTPQYMSPEQALGAAVDHRCDLFSLGCVLYAMGTGESPFPAKSIIDAVRRVCDQAPRPLQQSNPSLPAWLCQLIERLLAKDPGDRFQSAEEVARALERQHVEATGYSGAAAGLSNAATGPTELVRSDPLAYDLKTGEPHPSEQSDQGAPRSIAVLPFKNIGADAENEYFSEGLAEELLGMLAKLQGLKVAASCSAFQFKGQSMDVRNVGRQLNVDAVLEGSVRKAGEQLRIAVQLSDSRSGYQLWSERYDRQLSDLFAVQEEIARAIVSELDDRILAGAPDLALAARKTNNVEAFTHYLRGRYHWNRRCPDSLGKALDFYNRALAHDPRYSLALAGKADCLLILGMYALRDQRTALPSARIAAEGALRADQDLAEAHSAMGFSLAVSEYDWTSAERCFQRCFELNPNLAHARMAHAYSVLLATSRFDQALIEASLAARLDPVTPMNAAGTAVVWTHMRQYERALEAFEAALEVNPDCPAVHIWKSFAHLWSGQYHESLMALEQAVPYTLLVEETKAIILAKRNQLRAAENAIERFHARIGQNARALLSLARVYTALGQIDNAFTWLDRAFEERVVGLALINVDPAYDPLRSDPRFDQFLDKMHLLG